MIKRSVDIICSGIGLILLSPLFLIVGAWIKIDSPGPAFFRQLRVGQFGKIFSIWKFRSMIAASTSALQITTQKDPRITRAGRFLRKYKIDELPQLLNVFVGEMSLVGPRPEVPKYVELFKDDYKEILKLKPGITDYAAIEFRDEEHLLKNFDDPEKGYVQQILPMKIAFYKKYLKEPTFWTDIKIVFLTLKKLLS